MSSHVLLVFIFNFHLYFFVSCSFWPITMSGAGNIIASLMVGPTLESHQKRSCIWRANCFGGSLNHSHTRWSSCNLRFLFFSILVSVWTYCNILLLWFQKFDAEIFKISMPCICSIAGAIPPDYVDASYSSKTEKKASVDAEGNFDPKPVETTKWEEFCHYAFQDINICKIIKAKCTLILPPTTALSSLRDWIPYSIKCHHKYKYHLMSR